jgi:signal transduction histidine kinase
MAATADKRFAAVRLTRILVSEAPTPAHDTKRWRLGLSGKLLWLTVAFVMLAEILIYLPSIANFRSNFLNDRLAAARIAALVLEAIDGDMIPKELETKLLTEVGAVTMAVRSQGARRLLAVSDMPPTVFDEVDLRNDPWWELIADSLMTMIRGGERHLRVVGPGMGNTEFVEIVLPDNPLRQAMLRFSLNILLLSLIISVITAGLVFFALNRLIVWPVLTLARDVTRFAANPEDVSRILTPSPRNDEIGDAQSALASMENALAQELRAKKHLATLGLGVSKINHDLRNLLAAAQLHSDRLSASADPQVQRFVPKLVSALDRAISYCQSSLAYGRAVERAPAKQKLDWAMVVVDMRDSLGLSGEGAVRFISEHPPGLHIEADGEQLLRVLINLGRNASQALEAQGGGMLCVKAAQQDNQTIIDITDTGPGVPEKARQTLFEAFKGSMRPGGSGLGLAIAAELVGLHGGTISLIPSEFGAHFRIVLPRNQP